MLKQNQHETGPLCEPLRPLCAVPEGMPSRCARPAAATGSLAAAEPEMEAGARPNVKNIGLLV